MDPLKIIGGLMVLFGLIFRAISSAYFKLRAKSVPDDDPLAIRRHNAKLQRALLIDYAFILIGAWTIITH